MKDILVVATLIAVTFLVPAQTENITEIQKLNAQEVEALLHNDVATLKRLWSADFVVTNPFNKFLTKPLVVEMTESGAIAFTSYERKIDYIRIYSETAVVAGTESVVWGGKMPTAGQSAHLRFTSIWMKQDGRWQEIARHANILGP